MSNKDILKIENEENGLVLSLYNSGKEIHVNIGVASGDNITMSIRVFYVLVSLANNLLEMYMKIKDFSK